MTSLHQGISRSTYGLIYKHLLILHSSLSTSIVEDSLNCLQSLVVVDKGREHLWKYNSLYSLCQCFVIHEKCKLIFSSIKI